MPLIGVAALLRYDGAVAQLNELSPSMGGVEGVLALLADMHDPQGFNLILNHCSDFNFLMAALEEYSGDLIIKMVDLGAVPEVPEAGKNTRYKAQLLVVHEDFDDSLISEAFGKHPDRTDVLSLRTSGRVEPLCTKNFDDIIQAQNNGDKVRVIIVSHGARIIEDTPQRFAEKLHNILADYGVGNDNPPHRIRFESCNLASGERVAGKNYALDVFEEMKRRGMNTSFNVSMVSHVSQFGGRGIRTMNETSQLSPLWQGKMNMKATDIIPGIP